VRPTEWASVSAPVTWAELERGLAISDFTMATMAARVRRVGDLWAPVHQDAADRLDLGRYLKRAPASDTAYRLR
jgi:bifunctional non-homologous end joining protein LigD